MRGKASNEPEFFAVVNLEDRVPKDHPLRSIKNAVDKVLARMDGQFEDLYSKHGRRSVPPEVLLKSKILMALYSVRSERLFCEQLDYNMLWLWFLDREIEEGSFDHSLFSHHHDKVLSNEMCAHFFAQVYELSREGGWTSDEHFSADGTLIEAWASTKSFRPRKQDGDSDNDAGNPGNEFKPSNPEVDFRGEKRSNKTHQSRTDPESVLYRKGRGKESKLCFGAHALMENRNGFVSEIDIHNPIDRSEAEMALEQMDQLKAKGQGAVKSIGGDKNYHQKKFVEGCRERGAKPHVCQVKGRKTKGMDGRTTSTPGYQTSVRIRKRIEEIFGWMKTVGGLRKARHRGIAKIQSCAHIVAAAYNLIKLANLEASSA